MHVFLLHGSSLGGLGRLYREQGLAGWYKGLIPLILKQVPYTAVKFCVFEGTLKALDAVLPRKRAEYDKRVQLSLTFLAGFVGGVASAVASHPADTLLTAVNVRAETATAASTTATSTASTTTVDRPKPSSSGSVWHALRAAGSELGWSGVWRGLFPRMGMVGVMAACQLWVYDASKVLIFGLPVTQGLPSPRQQQISE